MTKAKASDATSPQCVRIKRDETQCKNPAMVGTTVCRMHGGKAPQTLRKAQERIDLAAARMVGVQVDIALDPNVEARDRINAAEKILNRSAEVRQPGMEVKLTGDAVPAATYLAIIAEARERVRSGGEEYGRGKVFALEDVVDAEVVDE